MPELRSPDGRYWCEDQGDGNFVVYDTRGGQPIAVWDRWSYEATTDVADPVVGSPVPPLPDAPAPVAPVAGTPRLIRVTDERDGELLNRGYAYWSQAWVAGRTVMIFCGHADGRPRFFQVDLTTGQIERLGSILSYTGTSEGWYWNAQGEIYIINGAQLHRVNPRTGADLVVLDIADRFPGHDLWQAHSSEDGQTHSATVRQIVPDGPYPYVGTILQRRGEQEFFRAQGVLDESQITSDGAYLILKEDDDNRIITVDTGETRRLTNAEGAVGHSDCGTDYVIGEDDQIGACVRWDLGGPLVPQRKRILVRFPDWNMGHVSVKAGRGLLTHGPLISLLNVQTGEVQPLVEHGMTGSDYDHQVMANLDPTGRVAVYMSNVAGRMDAYLLVVP